MNRLLILSIFLFSVFSCKKETKNKVDISSINVTVDIDRFEEKFYNTTAQSLAKLKSEYPYLFPIQNPDSVWLNRINNEVEKELFVETQKVFGKLHSEKKALENLFKHVKYYHSGFKSPKIITLISDLDYESNVMYADSLLFVSLDMYLGKNNIVYSDFPKYLSQNFEKTQIVVDVAHAISEKFLLDNRSRQFLNIIVEEGKKMYLVDTYLPSISDAQKIGYSSEKMDWVLANESQIWKYFVENKLLYSTDSNLYARFVANAPFSKFYIDIDKDSPGKIGSWLGWQIVRSYMHNNNVTLQQLLQAEATEIFNKSKYKPKK
jgi:gliding motility-associated lipoprotein GldB